MNSSWKKFPSTCKQKGPNAPLMRNNNNDGQGLKLQPMAEGRGSTQATGHRGKRAGLEEGRFRNKKEKAEPFNMG
ncbi:unnamed protein product [Arctogadus glacialis]